MAKTTLTTDIKHDRCRAILKLLDANIKEALQLAAMVNRLNNHEDVRAAFNETYEAHGLNVVFETLLRQLLIVLARMHDPYHPDNDRGGNRASLAHLMHLLGDKSVVRLFLDDARRWSDPRMNRQERDARAALRKIQAARVKYRSLMQSEATKWLIAVKSFRDIHLAHSLFEKTADERMYYGYIGDLLNGTKVLIPLLSVGLAGENWDLEDYEDEYAQMADRFWKVTRSGMLAKKGRERRKYRVLGL